MKLKRIGKNWNYYWLYQRIDENGELVKDFYVDLNDEREPKELNRLSPHDDPDGEPDYIVKNFEIVNPITDEEIRSQHFQADYMLLSRLQMDCNYFLGNGGRNEEQLWAGNVKGQIEKMKELWNKFPKDLKPEWCTFEKILEYEKRMA